MGKGQQYILTIDQSTSATKAVLVDRTGKIIYRKTIGHRQFYPKPGFVEHDPVEIWGNTRYALQETMHANQLGPGDIAAISITNQRETAMIWERESGKPVYPAVVWQCQRGASLCRSLREEGKSRLVREKTGLLIDPYFSASKLNWILKHVDGVSEKAGQGDLLAGTMDSWLLWNLTGGKVHATDHSNAGRTMLFNIHELQWDDELAGLFRIHQSMLPEIRFSDEVFGYTDPKLLGAPIPVAGLIGDSHAALFGQNCFSRGMAKATYGTGSSVMMNIGRTALPAPDGLVTSIGYGMGKTIDYVFEGNIHCTGDTINWLKNELGLISDASETEALAASVDDSNGAYLVPAFVGLGAPYWDNQARACLSSISRNTNRAHIVRAALESIAYQIKDLISLMEEKSGIPLRELRVDGGPTRNNFLMQFQADMLGRSVIKSDIEEVSALGSAFLAGLATGFWKDREEIQSLREAGKSFHPVMENEKIQKLYEGWKKAVERARL